MNRKYSPEFKQGAVEQANQPNVTLAQVAKNGHLCLFFPILPVEIEF